MGKREDLGYKYIDVINNWCLGVEPSINRNEAWDSLYSLELYWPEYIDNIVSGTAKGIYVMGLAFDAGIIINKIKDFKGFSNILRRIKLGERAALIEGYVASYFKDIGYNIEFEPDVNGKHPDILIYADDVPIYAEVVSPEYSKAIKEVYAWTINMNNKIMELCPGKRVNIQLLTDPGKEVLNTILGWLMNNSRNDLNAEISGTALVNVDNYVEISEYQFDKYSELNDGPELFFAGFKQQNNKIIGRVTTRMTISDNRAVRFISGESHHFSLEEKNILIIDVSQIAPAIKSWRSLIDRCLQPTRNTRFGAICLLRRYFANNAVASEWSIIENPYAKKSLPKTFINRIGS